MSNSADGGNTVSKVRNSKEHKQTQTPAQLLVLDAAVKSFP